jgi:alpha-mannosidase
MLPIFVLQLNLGIYLKDNTTDLFVLVDREVGRSSISDGELELMLHRYMTCA